MKKVMIMYASYSGNTEEVAQIIEKSFSKTNSEVDVMEITDNKIPVDLKDYDLILFGTFTWGQGGTPDFVKDFVSEIGWKPPNVEVFGTGDTQFGDENYCAAASKLSVFYHSKVSPLLIEQSPRGSQEQKVNEWCFEVLEEYNFSEVTT